MLLALDDDTFHPSMRVAGCGVICGSEVLLLQRRSDKPQPSTLGIPSGKVSGGEDPRITAVRELWEETHIRCKSSGMQTLGFVRVRFREYDFEYHMFGLVLPYRPRVLISPYEHTGFWWRTLKEAQALNLIEDMWPCFEQFYLPHYPQLAT